MGSSETNTRSFNLRVFGCQMNFYDGELIRSAFLKSGYVESQDWLTADVVLFHTCSVREHAEEKVHSLLGELRRVKKARPELVLAVIGCMADREAEDLFEREPHVSIVCGSRHFPELPQLVAEVDSGIKRVIRIGESEQRVDQPVRELLGHPGGHSTQVAVMRGCDLACTYCIVPKVRGPVESRPVDQIIDECKRLADRGVVDISLLGQTIDAYGMDLGRSGNRPQLAHLLDEMAGIEDIKRVRLITLHPAYCNQDLADAMARSPQFHRLLPIPLQSGSDAVLKRMKRGYNLASYRKRVDMLRNAMPDLELISDWIVGFPGETDSEFEASVAAMKEFQFLQSFVFQYSPRPGTNSAEGVDDVPKQVKGERNQRLLALQQQIARGRTPLMKGCKSNLLLEEPSERHPGFWQGRISNGHFALLPELDGQLRPGLEVPVNLVDWNGRQLIAESSISLKQIKSRLANMKSSQASPTELIDIALPTPSFDV